MDKICTKWYTKVNAVLSTDQYWLLAVRHWSVDKTIWAQLSPKNRRFWGGIHFITPVHHWLLAVRHFTFQRRTQKVYKFRLSQPLPCRLQRQKPATYCRKLWHLSPILTPKASNLSSQRKTWLSNHLYSSRTSSFSFWQRRWRYCRYSRKHSTLPPQGIPEIWILWHW